MSISRDGARQWHLTGVVTVSLADLVSGEAAVFDRLPPNSVITYIGINRTTAFDSGTSDTLTVGDADDSTEYGSGISLATAGLVEATPSGKKTTTPSDLVVKWTSAGDAPTQGEFDVIFSYITEGRANEVVPQ